MGGNKQAKAAAKARKAARQRMQTFGHTSGRSRLTRGLKRMGRRRHFPGEDSGW